MVIVVVVAVLLGLLGLFLLIPRGNRTGKGKAVRAKSRSAECCSARLVGKWDMDYFQYPSSVELRDGPKTYTKSEVSLHNKRDDCWIIVKNKVFDVTSYVEEHPGGDAILNHAGDDSTEGFYGPQHPGGVFQLVEDFCIGDLKQ